MNSFDARLRWLKKRVSRRKSLLLRHALGILAACLQVSLISGSLGSSAELAFADFLLRLRGPVPAPAKMFVVSIAEESFEHLRISPRESIPRNVLADALGRLRQYGASLVIFDLIFHAEGESAEGDRLFADALGTIPTVIGSYSSIRQRVAPDGSTVLEPIVLQPLELFARRAALVVTLGTQESGLIRHFPLGNDGRHLSLQSALQERYLGVESPGTGPTRHSLIRYYGPAGTMRSLPLYALIEDERLDYADDFRGATVFIGFQRTIDTAKAGKDSFLTPFSGQLVYGVEILATMAANIRDRCWTERFSPLSERLVLALSAFFCVFSLSALSPLRGLCTWIGASILWFGASYLAFLNGWFLPGATLFGIVIPVLFLLSTVASFLDTRRTIERMESAFHGPKNR